MQIIIPCFPLIITLLVSCNYSNSEKIKELETKVSQLEQEKRQTKLDSALNNNTSYLPNTYKSEYSIGDAEEKILKIQGTPTSVNDFGRIKVYGFGLSTLTFEKGYLKSYNNLEKNLHLTNSSFSKNNESQQNRGNTKFCYVYIKTYEPEPNKETSDLTEEILENKRNLRYYSYKSGIIEIDDFSEDKKFKLIDKFEDEVREGFVIKNLRLKGKKQCSIESSECFSFSTYKEASEHKRNN